MCVCVGVGGVGGVGGGDEERLQSAPDLKNHPFAIFFFDGDRNVGFGVV